MTIIIDVDPNMGYFDATYLSMFLAKWATAGRIAKEKSAISVEVMSENHIKIRCVQAQERILSRSELLKQSLTKNQIELIRERMEKLWSLKNEV